MVTASVTDRADRVALLDAAVVLGGPPLLLVEADRGDAEATEAAVGGVELGARRGDRDPHRRVRAPASASAARCARASTSRAPRRRTRPASTSSGSPGRTRPRSSSSCRGPRAKPPSSVHVDERAVPSSRRPWLTMSSAAARSATRTGWFISGTQTTAPCPTRMRSVRAATAVRNTSGDEQCE